MRIKEVSLILCMIFAVIFILPAVSAGNVIVKNGELNINDDFLINNSVFFVNSTPGNIGIGTATPSTKLEVSGTADLYVSENITLINGGMYNNSTEFIIEY